MWKSVVKSISSVVSSAYGLSDEADFLILCLLGTIRTEPVTRVTQSNAVVLIGHYVDALENAMLRGPCTISEEHWIALEEAIACVHASSALYADTVLA